MANAVRGAMRCTKHGSCSPTATKKFGQNTYVCEVQPHATLEGGVPFVFFGELALYLA